MTTQDQIKSIQKAVLVKQDGILGPKTIQAVYDKVVQGKPDYVGSSDNTGVFYRSYTADDRTNKNLNTLLPKARDKAVKFIIEISEYLEPYGITAKIISGNRTYAEQDALYAQGRTKAGPIVTNAKGGQSNHNFGIAWDIGLFKGTDYLGDSPFYSQIAHIGRAMGLAWGGDFSNFKDLPHWEVQTGLTMAQKRDRVAKGIPIL